MSAKFCVGLVHWPTVDKLGTTVCTNVTNLDIHDIARACRTYGVSEYFIINRMREQLMFVERILEHWRRGKGARYNSMRRTALNMVKTAETIEVVIKELGSPIVITTSAQMAKGVMPITFRELREKLKNDSNHCYLLLFGTGYGLHPEVHAAAHYQLEPIQGEGDEDYRHLSVRSAVTICLDRLLATW